LEKRLIEKEREEDEGIGSDRVKYSNFSQLKRAEKGCSRLFNRPNDSSFDSENVVGGGERFISGMRCTKMFVSYFIEAKEAHTERFIVISAILSAHVPHPYEMRPFKFKDGPRQAHTVRRNYWKIYLLQ
jgi:hypothetical protein